MSGYVVRPISDRTLFTGKHQPSRFDAPWSRTERLLLSEVAQLRGKNLVLEVDVTESMIRLDGGLYANARPASPAVRVAFESMHGPLTYGTDRFPHWQDNVRAIALGLEALRKVDRYGITKRGEQYAGWKAIGAGPGTGVAVGGMTPDQARQIITDLIGPVDRPWDSRFRLARAKAHPDRNDGDRTLWDQVEQAGRVLGVLS